MHRTGTTSPHRLIVVASICFAMGCADNLDPTEPVGAYNQFINALWAQNASDVWDRSAPSTHEYFQQKYEVLHEMDETIARYLPSTDHSIAREQAGSILTDKVKDGRGLFLELFRPSQLKLEEKHRVGAVVETIAVSEDELAAEIKTLGGDTFYLSRGGAGEEWYVMLVRSSTVIEAQMAWLTTNESALKQTIEDLIAEERKNREAVIAELMKLDAPSANSEDAVSPDNDGSNDGQEENP